MKRSVWMVLGIAAALAAFAVRAQGQQIGFVDMDRVFTESRAGQQSKSDLDNESAGYSRELEKLSDSARKAEDDLHKDSVILSERDRATRERRIAELKTQLERRKQAYTEEYGQHRDQAVADMINRIGKAVAKVAERDGLELVVNRAVAVDSSIDITQKVIRSLDEDSPDSK